MLFIAISQIRSYYLVTHMTFSFSRYQRYLTNFPNANPFGFVIRGARLRSPRVAKFGNARRRRAFTPFSPSLPSYEYFYLPTSGQSMKMIRTHRELRSATLRLLSAVENKFPISAPAAILEFHFRITWPPMVKRE